MSTYKKVLGFATAVVASALVSVFVMVPLQAVHASSGGGGGEGGSDAGPSWIKDRFEKKKPKAKRPRRKRSTVKRSKSPRKAAKKTTKKRKVATRRNAVVRANTVAIAAAANAENGVEICGELPEQPPRIECIALQFDNLAEALEKNKDTKRVMPKTITTIKATSKKLRLAKTKEEAVIIIQEAKIEIDKAIAQANKGETKEYGGTKGMEAITTSLGKGISTIQKEQAA